MPVGKIADCTVIVGHLTAMLRSLVIARIGSAGEQAVVDEAKKRFAVHCAGTAELPADLRSAVSC